MVQRTLVNHFTRLWVYFVLYHATHKFRLVHDHGIQENQDLTQMILAARAANRPHRAGLDEHRFA